MVGMKKKRRLSIEITGASEARLDGLLKKTECGTINEVFRKSLAIHLMLIDRYMKGGIVRIENAKGEIEIVTIL